MKELKSSIISNGDFGKRMPLKRNATSSPKIAGWASPERWVSKGRFSLAWAWAVASSPVYAIKKVAKVWKRLK